VKGFLIDENLPARFTFIPSLPVVSSSHALHRGAGDSDLWEFARGQDLVIVTKDTDFADRILISAPPPWVVHLRFGNLRRWDFHALLARLWPRIEMLLPEHKMITVYPDRIEAVK
jgi:predicted nuclease of predicted toxin-antitoxin system